MRKGLCKDEKSRTPREERVVEASPPRFLVHGDRRFEGSFGLT